jgi:hypothetical protein
MNNAASKPSSAAIFSCSALTLGSAPKTSSPRGAVAIASRMAAVGCVTVSLRRSMVGLRTVMPALFQSRKFFSMA